jgi:hypothetical protein
MAYFLSLCRFGAGVRVVAGCGGDQHNDGDDGAALAGDAVSTASGAPTRPDGATARAAGGRKRERENNTVGFFIPTLLAPDESPLTCFRTSVLRRLKYGTVLQVLQKKWEFPRIT